MNSLADRTLEEISSGYTGLGLFSSDPVVKASPSQVSRGQLPVNLEPPRGLDIEEGCETAVTEEQQQYCLTAAIAIWAFSDLRSDQSGIPESNFRLDKLIVV